MSNTITLKKSGVAGRIPTAGTLSLGEIALNYKDGYIFYRDNESTPAVHKINADNADTVDGFHLNQDVRSTASPTFNGVTASNLYLGSSSVRISPGGSGEIGLNYNTSATGSLVWYGGGTASKFSVTNGGNATFAGDINLGTGKSLYMSGANGLRFLHDGSNGNFINGTGDFKVTNGAVDKDIIFRGNDGGSSFTALTLDMSGGGYATFASGMSVGAINTTGTLDISNTYPRINLNDTNHEDDWSIINDDGNFTIYNVDDGVHALKINSSNTATFAGDITLGANHIGRDGDNYIGFETDNLIKFRVGGATQIKIGDGNLAPQTDSDVDLGSNTTRFRNVYADTLYGDGSNLTGLSSSTDNTKLPLAGGTMSSGAAITFTVPTSGGNFININHTGNEAWTIGAQSGSGVDDYLDIGISGGTRAMSWHETGKVGIGTTAPSSLLHIAENDNGGNAEIILENSFTNTGSSTDETTQIQGRFGGFDGSWIITGKEGDYTTAALRKSFLSFSTRTATTGMGEKMRITSTGNVGIGTTSPSTILDVSGTGVGAAGINLSQGEASTISNRLFFSNATANQGIAMYNLGGKLVFGTGATAGSSSGDARMYLTNAGNVGIGTSSPSSMLHLEAAVSPTLQIKDTTNNVTFKAYAQDSNSHLANTSNHDLFIDTNNTSRITVKADGKVGINTTTATLYNAFTVQGNANISNGDSAFLTFNNGDANIQIAYNNAGSVVGRDLLFKTYKAGVGNTEKLRIDRDGNVGIGTTSPSSRLHIKAGSSDYDGALLLEDNSDGKASLLTQEAGKLFIGYAASAASPNSASTIMVLHNAGNVGIGTTTPDHKLHVKGDITIDNESSSVPSMLHFNALNKANHDPTARINFWEGDGHTGTYTNSHAYIEYNGSTAGGGDGYLAIGGNTSAGANSDIMVINRLGRVGIGIASPASTFNVVGHSKFNGTSYHSHFNYGTDEHTYIRGGKAGAQVYINDTHNSNVGIAAGGGRVGIGTNSPDASTLLHVQGVIGTTNGTAAAPTHTFYGDSDNGMFRAAANTLAFSTDGNERLRINSSGDVGIGGTSNGAKLEIHQAQVTTQFDRDCFLRLHPTATTNSGGFTNIMFGTSPVNNFGVAIGGVRAGTDGTPSFSIRMLKDAIQGTEVLNITNSGNATFAGDITATGDLTVSGEVEFSALNSASASPFVVSDGGTLGTRTAAEVLSDIAALSLAGGTMTGHLNLGDSIRVKLGQSQDLQLVHDGSNSYIHNVGVGHLYLRQTADNKNIILESDNGSGGSTAYLTINGSTERIENLKNVFHYDNVRAQFGDGADLQIYHDGSNSYIQDVGTGDLKITTSAGAVRIDKGVSENMAAFIPDGAVELYHNNSKKFETTSTGVDITGHLSATTKSFLVDNPKTGGKLQYGVVESDEHGVYVRGKSDQEVVELPEEWDWLVHEDSVTVQLTSVGQMQQLFVVEQNNKRIKVSGLAPNGQYNYVVHGTRKDVDALEKHLK